VVIALVSKVAGVNNLNLTTTRGDRLIEAHSPLYEWLRAGFDQASSYTMPRGTTANRNIVPFDTWLSSGSMLTAAACSCRSCVWSWVGQNPIACFRF
jgi:hypothetical protein